MKATLFRLITATFSIFSLFIQIEINSFDAIFSTIGTISVFIFIIDFITYSENDLSYKDKCPYRNTEYGSITWQLFGKNKNKK